MVVWPPDRIPRGSGRIPIAGLKQRSHLEDYQLLAPNMAKKLRKANGKAMK